jgi:outer membrane protein assembly factor BamB/predicted Ser/Thr protein kinase
MLMDRYQIQEIIGSGGMGTVYRARDSHFQAIRLVAIKEMISNIADPLVRKNINTIYERESNILATLRHQAIPRIYDYYTQNDRAYLVMEFINGRDLDDLLAETTTFFPEEQILNWAVELCDVLQYLHEHKPEPIIFRDIKPSNIMINQQNHIVLVDFGIAKIFESGTKNTMVGTQGYSPPDQYRGEATPAVDIYAMGATLHHLLTLRDPRLEAPFSFAERPIKEINPNVSDEFVAVVDKALQYNPEDRFKNAQEFKEALLGVAKRTGTLIHSGIISHAAPGGTAPVRGVKALWVFECEDEVRGTPLYSSGSVYVGCYDNNLYALDAGSGEFKWKYATDGGIPGRPAVFEGNIYLGSEDQRLHVVSARSGSVVWTYFSEGPIRSSPRIAEGHVFIGSDDGSLHAVNVASGRLSWKAEAGAPVRSTPYITNDYVYVGTEAGELMCIDFRGTIKWRFKSKRAVTSSPVVNNEAVYFGSLDSTVYALDPMSGWVLWRFRLGKGTVSSPALSDGMLFIGAADNVIYCIDARSAKENWRFTTEHQVSGSPIVYNDSVYCGSVDGHLYCLEQRTGRLKWAFATEGPITGAPMAHEDHIYIGSTDKKIYALLA